MALIKSAADVTVSGGTSGQILGSNASRQDAIVQLLDSAPGSCRVADSNVGASRGVQLQPGDALTLSGESAIHAHNPNGSSADFAVIEIEDGSI